MRPHPFRVSNYRTLDTSNLTEKLQNTTRFQSEDKNFIRNAMLKYYFISARDKNPNQQSSESHDKKEKNGQKSSSQLILPVSQRLQKYNSQQFNIQTKIKKQNSKNSKFAHDMQTKREIFLQQYGYIKNKKKIQEDKKQKTQSIDVNPNIEDTNQRIYLSDVENMKIQKQLQDFSSTTHKSVKGQKNRLEKMHKAVYKYQQQIQKSKKQMELKKFVQKSKKALSQANIKIEDTKIEIHELTNSLMLYNNRIYGRKHSSDSVRWCVDVLNSHFQEPGMPINKVQARSRQKKIKNKQELNELKKKLLQELNINKNKKYDNQ